MTLVSRLLGFLRDIVFAMIFGAGPGFDAFVVAFKIPNFMRRLFAEGAFSQAFVPILAQYKEQQSPADLKLFVARVAGCLLFSALLVVLLVELLAPWVVLLFAPGFHDDPTRLHLAKSMLHITFPYLLLITLTAFAGAILNTYHRFALPAFAPVLLNVSLILVTWFWAQHTAHPALTLCYGVLLGGLLQVLVQLPSVKSLGLLVWPQLVWRDAGVQRLLKLMLPALFGVSVAQIGLLVDNMFASFLPTGSISWLYYSDRLTYLPLGVIGVALATVVMPHLASQHARGSQDQYKAILDWALRMAILIGLPAALGLFILATPILATLIQRGAFSVHDTLMSARSLRAFALGLLAFMLIKVLASAFYSRQEIKTPVKIAAVALVINVLLNFLLIKPLAHAGLALATSLAAWVNVIFLWAVLIKQGHYRWQAAWRKFAVQIAAASGVMAFYLFYFKGSVATWLSWHIMARVGHLAWLIVSALVLYVAVLLLFGMRKHSIRAPRG